MHNKTGSCSTDGMRFVAHDCVSDSATVCTDDDGSNPGQRPALSLMRRKATAAPGQRRLDLSRSLGRSRPRQSKRGRRPSSCRSQTSRSPSAMTWRQRATGPRSDPCSRCPPAQNLLLILQSCSNIPSCTHVCIRIIGFTWAAAAPDGRNKSYSQS